MIKKLYYNFTFQPIEKLFLKCKLSLFAYITLNGNNVTPYYLPLI